MRFLEFSQALFFKRSHKGFRVINFSHSVLPFIMVPLTNVCKESKSSPRLNCVESATCESQQ